MEFMFVFPLKEMLLSRMFGTLTIPNSLLLPNVFLAPNYPPHPLENVLFGSLFQPQNYLKIPLQGTSLKNPRALSILPLHLTDDLCGTLVESEIRQDIHYDSSSTMAMLTIEMYSGKLQNFVGMHPTKEDSDEPEGEKCNFRLEQG